MEIVRQIDRIEHKVDDINGRVSHLETWQQSRDGVIKNEISAYINSAEYQLVHQAEVKNAMVVALREVFSLKKIGAFFATLVTIMVFTERVIGYLT